MSELGAGRASNGGARTGGPVPVSSTSGVPSGMRTPRDIMRDRNAREARRQEEEQKRLAEERRKSAERRAAAAVPGAVPRFSNTSSQYSPDVAAQQGGFDGSGDRRSRGPGEVAGTNVLGEPVGRTSLDGAGARTRGSSVSQDQPRAAPSASGHTRRAASQSAPRQPPTASGSSAAQAAATQGGPTTQRGTSSNFPHAFERWETLSSHWEGLTSYWLHRLEQNTEEIKSTVPNAATLSRQITDLSAAGANLFHAVVELQRLRASSERKFQRWFFDTREHHEKLLEQKAELERNLLGERSTREEATRQQSEAAGAIDNARREVAEMRRELVIAKDEARRAWEELGRRNQESLDTAQSLKEGRVTVVSGVQVVPYFGGARTTSSAPRPVTRDGQPYGSAGPGSSIGRMQSPGNERDYYREASPTNTDPFTDSGRHQPLHHEPGSQSLTQGAFQPYQSGTPASAQTTVAASIGGQNLSEGESSQYNPQQVRGTQPTTTSGNTVPTSAVDAQRFYQHAGSNAYLHTPPTTGANVPTTAAQTAPAQRPDVRSEGSYVDTIPSDDDDDEGTEYALDASGNIRHDDQGRPIVFATGRRQRRRRRSSAAGGAGGAAPVSPEDEHGHELAARYAEQMIIPEAPSVPATSAQAMATYPPVSSAPDYEGEGYGGGYDDGRGPAHHYPTRLSDVLEEEEERSSRRTID